MRLELFENNNIGNLPIEFSGNNNLINYKVITLLFIYYTQKVAETDETQNNQITTFVQRVKIHSAMWKVLRSHIRYF